MDILSRPVLAADHRIPYGADPSQFGDLWLPAAPAHGKAPLVVFFHGGWWKSAYDLGYAGYLCAALKRAGVATWSVEYRRVGATGGGWPNTFLDAAAGLEFITTLARSYPLDLTRVITMGHSAGGHLAFWIAGRHHVAPGSAVYVPISGINLCGAVALAGAVDLELIIALAGDGLFAHDKHEVYALMGGSPAEHPERYTNGDPGHLLPLQAPQVLLQGTADDEIPAEVPARWAAKSRGSGSHATATMLPGADHLDVVDPESNAWPTVLGQVQHLLRHGA